ncbi:MAG TPA: VOC family protein [Mycobacteriales bacterium]|jgi:hypothetical protein
MTEKSGYAPGEPSWVDINTTDVAATRTFYATLFGWAADDVPMEDAGGYGMFSLGGRYVGGYGPTQAPGQPAAWSVYFDTEDVDKTAEVVTSAGGTVVMGPVDVFTSGRMAVFQDPAGAFFSVWQAGDHLGAQVQDEPNALTWVELTTSDTEGAKRFYAEVFGWGEQTATEGSMPYTEFQQGGRSIAGMMAKPAEMPAEVPSYWMPYFQPADIERTVAEAAALGATVMVPPSPIPNGRFAVLADPQGAAFGLYRPDAATPAE